MILSKFFKAKSFKPKWQDTDRTVRIEAINELDSNNAEEKVILQNILNNDEVEIVRRAALLKLNNFDDYLQASKQNSHGKIRAFADKQIIKMLLGEHEISLNTEQKQHFLTQQHKSSLLETWLLVEHDPQLIADIYQKLNKPQLLAMLFAKANSTEVQAFLVTQCQELTLLEKLLKKARTEEIRLQLSHKISALKDKVEKPIKVRKKLQLLLSKLLALKENSDYAKMLVKREELTHEWQTLQNDLLIFDEVEQQAFTEKYNHIQQQLDKIFAPKKEQYEQQQIAKKIKAEQQQACTQFQQQLDDVNKQLVTCVFEDIKIDQHDFAQQLTVLTEQIEQSVIKDQDKKQFTQQISQLNKRLQQLPQIAQSVSDATQLISKVAALALPEKIEDLNERYGVYQQWLTQWQQVEKESDGLLPESILSAYQEIQQRWQQGVKPLLAQQEKLFHQTRKKLHDLKRLLNSGKYNTCFGLFKKTKQQYQLLSSQQQHKLQRDFTAISEKIAELSDWEHYIATPRKQELLNAINTLVNNPCDNPNEQADKVKQYRKQWNLLGHADDEIDQQLNKKFNEACEQAFAPCRAFYAEQEKIREQNYQNRLALIEQASILVDQFKLEKQQDNLIDYKNFDHQLTKLTQKWQKSGEVERNKYKTLLNQFNETLVPLKEAIHQYHEKNIAEKKQLIKQAEAIVLTEDSRQAIQDIKALQQQWKTIGYAGARHENKLWQTFRKINDQVFAKRNQDREQEQSQLNEKEQHFYEQLEQLQKQLTSAEHTNLDKLTTEAEDLLAVIIANKPVLKKVLKQVEKFIEQVQQQKLIIQTEKQQQQWQAIFQLVTLIIEQELSKQQLIEQPLFAQISPSWQKRLQDALQLENKAEREEKTLALEILAGVESPPSLSNQRMAIQVALMQEQMTTGNKADINALFIDWLLAGKLTTTDLAQLKRLEAIFL